MQIISLNTYHATYEKDLVDFLVDKASTTDIFLLQEVPTEKLILFNAVLSEFNKFEAHKFVNPDNYFDNVTYIKKHITCLSCFTVLENQIGIGLGLVTNVIVENTTLSLCNFHGYADPGNKLDTLDRLIQSREIIKQLAKAENNLIIAGDFNLELETKSIQILEQARFENLIRKFNISNTRNENSWKKYEDKQFYADFAFTRGEVKVNNFQAPYNLISDHLPMIIDFEIQN